MGSRNFFATLASLLVLAIVPAHSQTWPDKPIRLIVPAGPGGPNDVLARIVAQVLQPALKQSVVVEKRAGAGAGLGARGAAGAAADGYTLLVGNTATLAVIPAVSRNPGYDSAKNFVAVAKLIDAEQSLVISPTLPVRSVPELIAYARLIPASSISPPAASAT